MRPCFLAAILMLSSCSHVAPLIKLPWVETAIEEGAEHAVEGAAALAGQEVDAEFDLNPSTNPKCKQCKLHCPN